MAKPSEEWTDFEFRRDEWEQTLIALEAAKVRERDARWKMNDAAQKLMEPTK